MDKLLTELPKEVLPEDLKGIGSEKDFDASMRAVKEMELKLKDNLRNTEELSKIFKK